MGLLAIVLGFWTLSPAAALSVVTKTGYWCILGTSIWFGWTLYRLGRMDRPWLAWREKFPPGAILLVLGCGMILLVHERFGFKILMDEIMLLGTSMGMHFDKHPLVPVRGHDLQGAFQLIDGRLDKRPLFQPFLVSTLHDLTGYRPENAFVLNSGLIFVLLGLAFHVGRKLAGHMAGILAVLLLTTLPLLAQNATGGGFELLNLVMITATLALGIRYCERPDLPSQGALLLTSVLLAQTRYESALFLLPVGLLLMRAWWRNGRPLLDWSTVFVPLLFLPVALHQKIFSARESAWEMASQPGFERPFSLGYASVNFPHWLNFFFDTTGEHSNSIVLSVLGFLALPFMLLWVVKTLRSAEKSGPVPVAHAIFAIGFAAHSLLMLFYFWGRFDDPVIRRLSLPLNLWLVLAVVIVASQFGRFKWTWPVLLGLTGIGLFSASLPAMARHDYSMDYYVGRETEWRREFMKAHPEKDYLFIDPDALTWITHKVSATPVNQALDRKAILLFNFKNRTFTAFYAFQRYSVDTATGALTVQHEYDLGPDYELETVWERRFTPLTVSRISRVVSIREGGASATPPAAPPPAKELTPAEREKIRQAYFEQLIKRLP
ncbi:MAG: hypothetical protein QG602_1855 [Verrucomicrobiota bacterium]|nr:hypothetical protein [Verrucomicrobiota bacterium]